MTQRHGGVEEDTEAGLGLHYEAVRRIPVWTAYANIKNCRYTQLIPLLVEVIYLLLRSTVVWGPWPP